MKGSSKSWLRSGLLGLIAGLVPALAQPLLTPGDRLAPEQLNLTVFGSGDPLDLRQFEGKILYLEWFYWW